MKPESRDRLKLGALAVALGAATWLLAPVILPANVPPDFPKLPDLGTFNPTLRELLKSSDRDARRHPSSPETMGKLGMVYHANLLFAQAARAYRIAARLAPGDSQWVYSQALLDEENGNETEELRLLQETLRLNSNHVPSLVKLADAFFKLDRLDEAENYYQKAAQAPGGNVFLQATFGMGRVAARRRDWRKIVALLAPLVRTYPNLRPPYELLTQAYEELGQTQEAGESRESAALAAMKVMPPPEDPFNDQLNALCYTSTRLLKQAGFLSRTAHTDQAIELARRAASVDPMDADARNFIAHALIVSHADKPEAVDEALTQLEECLRLRPDDLTPLWNFTNDFFTAPRTGAPVERLATLLRAHANSPEAHLSLGLVAEAKGDVTEAVSQYEAALKKNANDSVAHNKLGQIFDRQGKYSEAVAHFQRSVHLDPTNALLRRNFGIALLQQGNNVEAVKEFGEVLRLNAYDTPTLVSMGFALLNLKRVDEAIPKFRDVVRSKPDSPEGHFGLAFALSAKGRPGEALPEVQAALKLRPEFPEAQQLLQRLEH